MPGLVDMLRRPMQARAAGPRSAGGLQRSGYFAEGGEVEEGEKVSPELKLAAFELLECLDSSRYGPGDGGKVGRADAFAKHLLEFFHLAESEPHEEGPHVEPEEME